MSLQNRVSPFGEIVATPARGTLMGNRGCLHNEARELTRNWARPPWVTCRLAFNGRYRKVMSPGQYTELFFLDEATALAAGHRPCATCRREDFKRFKALWIQSNPDLAAAGTAMAAIDKALQAERVDTAGHQRTWSGVFDELPDGAMVVLHETDSACLVWQGGLQRWSFDGYGPEQPAGGDLPVEVLTPPSVVKVLKAGYRPQIHTSVLKP